MAQLRSYLSLAKADQVPLETATLSYIADQRMKRAMVELQMSAGSLEMLERALTLARTLAELPFELNLWQAQNIWYEILRTSTYALAASRPKSARAGIRTSTNWALASPSIVRQLALWKWPTRPWRTTKRFCDCQIFIGCPRCLAFGHLG